HCFGCGKGGDVFKFVMEKEGLSFPEALQMLADQAGVTLSKIATGGLDKRKSLLAINELAAKFYQKVLLDTEEGRKAQSYLTDRGLVQETLAQFRIGCAPANGHALVDFLKKREVPEEDIEKAGLASRKGNYLQDKFVHRVMFPICDALGRVVAFTGRVLDEKYVPKYLNSPETPIFKKGEILFGLHLAKDSIQKLGYVVLVEGQMDAISSYQAGVTNVVATSGTAISDIQLQMLRRYTGELVLALDADNAGVAATKRVFEMAVKFDVAIKVVLLGEAKDPDVLIKHGEAWQKAIAAAVPMMDFYFMSAIGQYDSKSLEGRKGLTRELLSIMVDITDPVEKDFYIKKLSSLVGVETRALYDALSRPKPRHPFAAKKAEIQGDQLSPSWLEDRIVALALHRKELIPQVIEGAKSIKWASGLANTIYETLVGCYTSPDSFRFEDLLAQLPAPQKTGLLELMLVVEESYQEVATEDLAKEIALYLGVLTKWSHTARRQELVLAITEAEKSNDHQKLTQLLSELNQLN
ncbi:DNA primase, partial [Candidatus Saccharibacteria bacterium]|nr:DNA primase [Candidatus Saccharibacteria bacterium]